MPFPDLMAALRSAGEAAREASIASKAAEEGNSALRGVSVGSVGLCRGGRVVVTECERHVGRWFGGGNGVVVVSVILWRSCNIWGREDWAQ